MKTLKIISFVVFALILLDGFAYYNLLTSEKYEVDLLETHYKVEGKNLPNEKIDAKKKEITKQKKKTKIELVILSPIMLTLLGILIYKNYKLK